MRGTIRIAKPVLATLVELAALKTPGVAKLHAPHRLPGLGGAGQPRGVQLTLTGDVVTVTLTVVVEAAASMPDVGRAVQESVGRAIRDLAGLTVGEINVMIHDVEGAA